MPKKIKRVPRRQRLRVMVKEGLFSHVDLKPFSIKESDMKHYDFRFTWVRTYRQSN